MYVTNMTIILFIIHIFKIKNTTNRIYRYTYINITHTTENITKLHIHCPTVIQSITINVKVNFKMAKKDQEQKVLKLSCNVIDNIKN